MMYKCTYIACHVNGVIDWRKEQSAERKSIEQLDHCYHFTVASIFKSYHLINYLDLYFKFTKIVIMASLNQERGIYLRP